MSKREERRTDVVSNKLFTRPANVRLLCRLLPPFLRYLYVVCCPVNRHRSAEAAIQMCEEEGEGRREVFGARGVRVCEMKKCGTNLAINPRTEQETIYLVGSVSNNHIFFTADVFQLFIQKRSGLSQRTRGGSKRKAGDRIVFVSYGVFRRPSPKQKTTKTKKTSRPSSMFGFSGCSWAG